LKDENSLFKATITETDKSRDLIIRELSNIKEVEQDRIKEVERAKNAEIKVLEAHISRLKDEKKRMEEVCTGYDERLVMMKEKGQSEMHSMV
jgi:hypothetical protein